MKATKATIQQRVEEVLAIRLDGAEFWDIRQYVSEKQAAGEPPWTIPEGDRPLCDRTLWRYLAEVDNLIAESCRGSRKKLLRRHLAQRRNLFAKANSAGDYRTALAILKDEAELLNLYPPKKTELTGKAGAPLIPETVEMADAERAAAITALYARLGAGDN